MSLLDEGWIIDLNMLYRKWSKFLFKFFILPHVFVGVRFSFSSCYNSTLADPYYFHLMNLVLYSAKNSFKSKQSSMFAIQSQKSGIIYTIKIGNICCDQKMNFFSPGNMPIENTINIIISRSRLLVQLLCEDECDTMMHWQRCGGRLCCCKLRRYWMLN